MKMCTSYGMGWRGKGGSACEESIEMFSLRLLLAVFESNSQTENASIYLSVAPSLPFLLCSAPLPFDCLAYVLSSFSTEVACLIGYRQAGFLAFKVATSIEWNISKEVVGSRPGVLFVSGEICSSWLLGWKWIDILSNWPFPFRFGKSIS